MVARPWSFEFFTEEVINSQPLVTEGTETQSEATEQVIYEPLKKAVEPLMHTDEH